MFTVSFPVPSFFSFSRCFDSTKFYFAAATKVEDFTMNIVLHFLRILVLLGGVQFSVQQATPTPNPECSGMDKAVKHAQQAIKKLVKHSKCVRNSNCSGLSCTGLFRNNPLSMKIELRQCDNPIKAHVDLTNGGTSFHKDVEDGHPYNIVDEIVLKMTLIVRLKRNGNVVMAGVTLNNCAFGNCKHIELINQNFTVIMRNCPGYSTVSPPPSTLTRTRTTATSSTGPSTKATSIARKTTLPKIHSTASPPTAWKTTTAHYHKPKSRKTHTTESARTKLHSVTEKPRHSAQASTRVSSKETPTTKMPRPSTKATSIARKTTLPKNSTHSREPIYAKHMGGKKSGLSSGQAAGIAVGCIIAVLIVVGVLFYYKRCYRRARLRSAYYNDISMNDPLYDDFGPEIA